MSNPSPFSLPQVHDGLPVAVIGGGPAGLMAAETLARAGVRVDVFDAMPSVGRKFLLAGRGGLNLTHAEAPDLFLSRYGARRERIMPWLTAFGQDDLRAWAHGLGVETFVGSSGRVFPLEKKAAPLLRAWLHRLRQMDVRFHARHRWLGWDEQGALHFAAPYGAGKLHFSAAAVVLALGGGSWPQLGSDGAWVRLLEQRGIAVAPLKAANCGFDVAWSAHFRARFAGQPVKTVVASPALSSGTTLQRQGEFVVTENGVEGGLIYALSAALRDEIERSGTARLLLDLAPAWETARLLAELSHPRGSRSWSSHIQSRLGIKGVKGGLLRELTDAATFADPMRLAAAIKALPLDLVAPRPLAEAISSAGGVTFDMLDDALMLHRLPGVFCAGEMLDWEAPTGGYLLTACLASGHAAGKGALAWLAGR